MTDPVRIGGFFAPFDTEAVISQLIAIRQVPIQRLEYDRSLADARKATIEDLAAKFASLRNRVTNLTTSLSVSGKTATASSTALTVTAGPSASSGSFTVDIVKVATATKATGSVVSSGVNSAVILDNAGLATDVTAGDFTINGVTISVDPAVDTLDDVIARITASGAGVTASLQNDSDGRPNILRLTSASSISLGAGGDDSNFLSAMNLVASPGTTTRESTRGIARIDTTAKIADTSWLGGLPAAGAQSFTINGVSIAYNTANDSLGDILNRINASSAGVRARYDSLTDKITLEHTQTGSTSITLADDGAGTFLAKAGLLAASQVAGQNAQYSVDGGATQYSATNTVSPVAGVSVTLAAVTTVGSPVTVTVSQNTTSALESVRSFVTDFNAVMAAIQSATLADGSKENNQSGLLSGDASIRQLAARLRGTVISAVDNIDGAFDNLGQVGLSFGAIGSAVGTTNTLKLDEAKFRAALESDGTSVQKLFNTISFTSALAPGGTSSVASISGAYTGTKAGTYDITDDGVGNLEIIFTPNDGSAATTTTKSIAANQAYTDIIPGLTVTIGAALQAGTSVVQVSSEKESPLQKMKLFLDQQVGPGRVLYERTERYDALIKDIKERQVETQDRIDREMDRLRARFTQMEMAQARAQSVLATLQQMSAQIQANRNGS